MANWTGWSPVLDEALTGTIVSFFGRVDGGFIGYTTAWA